MKSGRQGRWEGLGWRIALETEMNREVNGGVGGCWGAGRSCPRGQRAGQATSRENSGAWGPAQAEAEWPMGRWGGEHGPGADLAESRLCWDPVWLWLGPGLASGPKAPLPPTMTMGT